MSNDSAAGSTASASARREAHKREGWLHQLHVGTGAFPIVGKRKIWYVAIGLLLLISVASIGFRGFNLGIEFVGGTQIQMPASGVAGPIQSGQAEKAYQDALGHPPVTAQSAGSGGSQSILLQSQTMSPDEVAQVKKAIFSQLQPVDQNGQPSAASISDSAVSGTWGSEITQQALIALGVFLVLVAAFLAFYFERWMAVAAIIALIHDVVVTAGLYALVGFEVTPATVIGLLTILGFSLYDTVVVFDKVKENTRGLLGLTRRTYPEAANLAANQTLMRSINTSVIAILPVLGLLIVGAGLLGVGTLKDLGLVQLIGMLAGTMSSILLATPLLVDFKMRDSRFREQERKVLRRRRQRSSDQGSDADEGDAETAEAGGAEASTARASVSGAAGEPVGAWMESPGSGGPRAGASGTGRTAGKGSAPQGKSQTPRGKGGRPGGKKRR